MQLPTYEENDRYYIMNVQCYQLIWLCGINIGITDITEMNYERVYNRIAIYENIFGATLQSKTLIKFQTKLGQNGIYYYNIDLDKYYKTGQILGGSKIQIFRYVYFPMTAIGVYNAIILVFMTMIGFYLTPALLGGSKGKFITEQIIYNIEQTLNWGLATALTSTLFFVVMLLFGIYAKLNKGITHA
jgi:hypothetical protein